MLKLDDWKTVFVAVGLMVILILASPTLGLVLHMPEGERFSELWVLGPTHMAEKCPFNIRANETYNVFMGVGNHMGVSSYYLVLMKFKNESEPLPGSKNGTPSPLPPVFEYRVLVGEGKTWETEITFSFSALHFNNNASTITYLRVGGYDYFVNKTTVWDSEKRCFYYQLFFELWRSGSDTGNSTYHQRFVGFWLNATA